MFGSVTCWPDRTAPNFSPAFPALPFSVITTSKHQGSWKSNTKHASMSSIQLASTSGLYPVLNKEAREIRLVTIVSSLSSSERIGCKLAIFPLKDAPQYAALSYVWGDIKETAPITLNDTEVRVTTNLLAALQRLSQKP